MRVMSLFGVAYEEVILCSKPCTSWVNFDTRYHIYQRIISQIREPYGMWLSDFIAKNKKAKTDLLNNALSTNDTTND